MTAQCTEPAAEQALVTDDRLGSEADTVYAALVAAHEGLSAHDGQRLNVRLVLLLANHIGSAAVIHEALVLARTGLEGEQRR